MSAPFPSSLLPKIKRFRLDLNENKASLESIFTRQRQVVSLSGGTGDRWEGVLEMAPLIDRPGSLELRTWWGWVNAVGLYGDFTIQDPDYTGAQSGIASALVNGASQSGTSLACDGVTASVVVLRQGEYFQVGTQFFVVAADVSSNGSGQFTVTFKPALRASPADNAVVTLNNPQLLLKLTSKPSKETDDLKFAVPVISFEESL